MFVAKGSASFIITVLNFYHILRVKISTLIHRISSATNVFLVLEQVIFGVLFITIKINVEIKYTNITCSTSYFEKISLQLGCQCNWSESCLEFIFRTDCL